jgi:hypothetical protein
MPFDQLLDDGGDDPADALRRWALVRVSFCESALADGSAHHLQQARFVVDLIAYEVWMFTTIWGYQPDLGAVGLRLDLVRQMLG